MEQNNTCCIIELEITKSSYYYSRLILLLQEQYFLWFNSTISQTRQNTNPQTHLQLQPHPLCTRSLLPSRPHERWRVILRFPSIFLISKRRHTPPGGDSSDHPTRCHAHTNNKEKKISTKSVERLIRSTAPLLSFFSTIELCWLW